MKDPYGLPDDYRYIVATRLQGAIKELFNTDVDINKVGTQLFNSFLTDENDFRYLKAILQPKQLHDQTWYLLTTTIAGKLPTGLHSPLYVSYDLETMILYYLAESRDISYDDYICDSQTQKISFIKQGKMIANISPLRFSDTSSTGQLRARNTLKGIRRFNESHKICKRLSKLPGMSIIKNRDCSKISTHNGPSLLKDLKGIRAAFSEILEGTLERELPIHQVHHLMAKTLGVDNWHILASADENYEAYVTPVAVHTGESSYSIPRQVNIYRNPFSAVWEFSRRISASPDELNISYEGVINCSDVFELLAYTNRHANFTLKMIPQITELDIQEYHAMYLESAKLLLADMALAQRHHLGFVN